MLAAILTAIVLPAAYQLTPIANVIEPTTGVRADCEVIAINSAGTVTGRVTTTLPSGPLVSRALLWSAPNHTTILPLPPFAVSTMLYDINDAGVAVGEYRVLDNTARALYVVNGVIVPGHLLTPPEWPYALAGSVNDFGVVAGAVANDRNVTRGCYWEANGTFHLLPTLPGSLADLPQRISDDGTIAGYSVFGLGSFLFWQTMRWTDMGDGAWQVENLGADTYLNSAAYDIADDGTICGYGWSPDGSAASPHLWDGHSLAAGPSTIAIGTGISDNGQLVSGGWRDGNGYHGCFWDAQGGFHDLSSLSPAGESLYIAREITNSGALLVQTSSGDHRYAYLAVSDTAVGDLNGDGVVNSIDLGILLSAWGTAVHDLNGDGVVNTLDLGILLAHWTQ